MLTSWASSGSKHWFSNTGIKNSRMRALHRCEACQQYASFLLLPVLWQPITPPDSGLNKVIPGCGAAVWSSLSSWASAAQERCMPGARLKLTPSESWPAPSPTSCMDECGQVSALSAAMQDVSHYVMQTRTWGTFWHSLHLGLCEMLLHRAGYRFQNYIKKLTPSNVFFRDL